METWEDGDCPWCRSLLGSGRALAGPGPGRRKNDRSAVDGGDPTAWAERALLVVVPVAALTFVAALVLALA
ncbi:hypothetical protein [Streptomyces sp. NRRL S-340]|uniref:hypothetical protein n=1 Tax=Streptomyces sp. NRRL S-340 TaxID=1463901 RepID=UPI000566BD3D|nr:hypothetical protein [Streptomyces sp. NRRL S-340]